VTDEVLRAEQALLGAVLLGGYHDVEHLVDGDDFYRPAHGTIWDACVEVSHAGAVVEPNTVMQALMASQDLIGSGGAPYLHELVSGAQVTANVVFYAKQVQNFSQVRKLRELGIFLSNVEAGVDTRQVESEARVRLADVHSHAQSTASRVGALLDDFLERLEQPFDTKSGIRWPYRDVNELVLPMRPGQFILIAGRPAMGKSICAVDIARDVAIRQQKTVVFHSLEMSFDQLMVRLIAAEAGIPLDRLNRHELTDQDWIKISKAQAAIIDAPLFIDDRSTIHPADVRASIRSYNADLAIVDHFGLVQAPMRSNVDRRVALGVNSREFKNMAKEEGVPVVAPMQLNRGPADRADKRPVLTDLRESGDLEQDADVVVLLHREDYYEKESVRAGELDFIVAKQREGASGDVVLSSRLHLSKFDDLG
jgi:replicative DNA helicase